MFTNDFNFEDLDELQEIRTYLMNEVDHLHRVVRLNSQAHQFCKSNATQTHALRNSLLDIKKAFLNSLAKAKQGYQCDISSLSHHFQSRLQEKDDEIEKLNRELIRIKENYLDIEQQVDIIIRDENTSRAAAAMHIKQLEERLAQCTCLKHSQAVQALPHSLDVISEKDQEQGSSQHQDSMEFTEELVENNQQQWFKGPDESSFSKKQGRFIVITEQKLPKKHPLNRSILEQIDVKREILSSQQLYKFSDNSRRNSFNEEKKISIKINLPKKKTPRKQPIPEQIFGSTSFLLERLQNSRKDKKGMAYYSRGFVYHGDLVNNKRHGFGVLKKDGQEIYHGEWREDAFHGEGRLKNIKNLERKKMPSKMALEHWVYYSGQFRGNLFEGLGSMVLANGDKFIGKFREGLAEGEGTYIPKEGREQHAVWSNSQVLQHL